MQRLMQADAALPDYWSYDYSGERHWKYANDDFYANPQEWIDGMPHGYEVQAQLAQVGSRSQGVDMTGTARFRFDNKIPNPSAWTEEQDNHSDAEVYNATAPQDYYATPDEKGKNGTAAAAPAKAADNEPEAQPAASLVEMRRRHHSGHRRSYREHKHHLEHLRRRKEENKKRE